MLLKIVLTLAALFILFMLWGILRLRKGNHQAADAISKVRLEDIEGLVAEGTDVLAKSYNVTINLSELEPAAKALDGLFADQMKLKNAFQKENFYWRFALPLGAIVGELVRIHAKGVWKQSAEGPFMEIPVKDGSATCYPFHKILKQVNKGENGDMYAFLLSSRQLSQGEIPT